MIDGLNITTKEVTDLFPYMAQMQPQEAIRIASNVHRILFKLCANIRQEELDKCRDLERKLYIAEKAVKDAELAEA